MSFVVLIPARLASTRLPDKPLADIHGKPMVVRVAERARRSSAQRVVVAADSPRIVDACSHHGVQAVLTRVDHPSGSDRLAEACERLHVDDDTCVVNVQGDEPLIDAHMIDACAALLMQSRDCVMSTVAHAIHDPRDFANPNIVKVVLDQRQRALYFSRAPIPWWRDGSTSFQAGLSDAVRPLRHVGLYGYRAGFLKRFPTLEASPLEAVEALEQLRVLWHGERIAVHVGESAPAPGVDTPEDLERVRAMWPAG